MPRSKVLGIDLGTTNSAVAIAEGGETEILKNRIGEPTTPSVVRFPTEGDEKDRPYVGRTALNEMEQYPERTVRSIKRKMGDSEYQFGVDDELYSPAEISAFTLRHLREDAAEELSVNFDTLDEAIITVPAYFSEEQRQATRAAAKMAEFSSISIINEPTAAAMAYGYRESSEPGTILVYDLGGGTFDVSVLDIGSGAFRVQATNGIRTLGGDDFDKAIGEWVAERYRDEHNINPLTEQPDDGPVDLLTRKKRIFLAAREAKESISTQGGTVTISLPFLMEKDGQVISDFSVAFTVETLERLTGHLITKTVEPTLDAIQQADYNVPDIDNVILVGGSTRLPMVKQQLDELFPIEPDTSVDPDEAVARGAAIHGNDDNVLLQEVTPLTLGIEVEGGKFKPLVPRNTTLPTSESEIFTTANSNATSVRINAFQGEHQIATKNKHLREFYLQDIPPQPRGVPQIEVEFRVDREGIVTARAEMLNELHGDKSTEITIEGVTDITDADIQEHISEVNEQAEESEQRVQLIEALNETRKLRTRAERYVDEYKPVIPERLQSELEQAINTANESLAESNTNIADLENCIETLDGLLVEVGGCVVDAAQSNSTFGETEEYIEQMTSHPPEDEEPAEIEGQVEVDDGSPEPNSAGSMFEESPREDESVDSEATSNEAGSGELTPTIVDVGEEDRGEAEEQRSDEIPSADEPFTELPDEPANSPSANGDDSTDDEDGPETDSTDSDERQGEIEAIAAQGGEDSATSTPAPDIETLDGVSGPDLSESNAADEQDDDPDSEGDDSNSGEDSSLANSETLGSGDRDLT